MSNRLYTVVFLASVLLSLTVAPVAAAQAAQRVPPGFRLIEEQPGVALWRKGKDYMQVIAPQRGARIELLSGEMIPSDGAGTNFARKDLRDWWKEWSKTEPAAYALLNGQFFNTENPAKSPLAFSTKIDGIVYTGYGDTTEYKGRKMVLRIGDKRATVQEYDDNAGSLYAFAESDIIVGLKPDVSKTGNIRRGRTFMATMPNGNLLIFTSPGATQRYATRILTAFGAERNRIMMLDGGGSTQLILKGKLLIPETRRPAVPVLRAVPLAIGIIKAEKL